ncbi:receptor-type tyrosine-protein phosphatase S-like isoform X2 [Portunus trituberculatus]|uniref:receptor-type tyrosine-protein phosphatase S-like isoform X2 n=1 Tax=Portunus trituberculatus TaxID=210409 RepID=UPI001E1CD68A|nr:receptor-type tyrosine-protein phosphatase S-like isoform X2 [Portunus trituberculatus]
MWAAAGLCDVVLLLLMVVVVAQETLSVTQQNVDVHNKEATNVSSVVVDAVMNESSLLDVFWTTQDDFPNYSTNFSVTWARLGDVRVDEAFTTDLQYTIAGLDAFTTYNVCVATCVSNGPNYPVCGVNTTTKESVPGRPVNVTAKAEGAEALWVGWEPPVEPNGVVISYTVIWTHAVTRHADTLDVDGNTTSVVISSLQPCTNYTITVSAATAAGSGQTGGPAKATTEIEVPGSPTEVSASQVESQPHCLNVTWTQAKVRGNCHVTSNTVIWWLAASGDLVGNETFPATVQVSLIGLQSSTTYSVGVSASVLEIKGSSAVRVNGTTARAGTPSCSGTLASLVGLCVAGVALVLAVAGVAIYCLRYKLKISQPRPRVFSSVRQSGLGHSLSLTSKAAEGTVRVEDLRYIEVLEEDTQRRLEEEFEQVQQSSSKHPTVVASQDHNKYKNRFRNILPFDHSRVILFSEAGEADSDYINANYIKDVWGRNRFIACQAPLEGTVGDMWRLVWQHDSRVVVMLTNSRERGREVCAVYWPTLEGPVVTVGDLTVTTRSETSKGGLRVREFLLEKGKEQRPVRQYQLTTWLDFGVPNHELYLLDFICELRDLVNPECGPHVVHCRAGVGRTGTFIGLWNLMDTVDAGQRDSVNVRQTVLAMRECRFCMVQTPEQYLYLYKSILAYMEEPQIERTKNRRHRTPREPRPQKEQRLAYHNPAFTQEAISSAHHA